MMVSLHIFTAIVSLGLLTYGLITLSRSSVIAGYVSVVLTLLSGFYLVWSEPATMLHACTAGLLYSIGALAIIAATKVRIAHRRNSQEI